MMHFITRGEVLVKILAVEENMLHNYWLIVGLYYIMINILMASVITLMMEKGKFTEDFTS